MISNDTIQKASRDYTVLFYHVDQKHDLSISSLFDFYTEIALFHTKKAGFDFDYLDRNKFKWILYKMNIKVNRYPRIHDNIRICTWGYNIIKFNAYRKFEMLDESGNILSSAKSIWLMVDAERMRPVRIPDEMFDGYGIERDNKERLDIDSLEEPVNKENHKIFSVHYSDLDYNQHATSARYTDWALETIPYDTRVDYDLTELTINYFRELRYGDPVKSVCMAQNQEDLKTFTHGIYSGDDKPATLMRSTWRKRNPVK